jgi:LL-diaminopimelate aminotransferase
MMMMTPPQTANDSLHPTTTPVATRPTSPLATPSAPPVVLKTPSSKSQGLPLYVFAQLAVLKEELRAQGHTLVDLGMGNPDQPTPPLIIEALSQAIANPANHAYPDFEGKLAFREAIAHWMHRRYGIALCPKTQVQPLIGSKEGIANLLLAYLEPGDVALLPSLYYPTYMRSTVLSGATPYLMPLEADNGFLPNLQAIPAHVVAQAKVLMLNYPNNPTGACAPRAFYEEAVAFCRQHGLVLVTDMAYGEIAYEGYRPLSIFEVEGAEDVAIEFHSFSKSFNMAGWRLGFAVGNANIINALYKAKTTMDYGVCNAIQDAGTVALNHAEALIQPIVATYEARRNWLVPQLQALGWETLQSPEASFYLWLKVPPTFAGSYAWVEALMRQAGVVVTPGLAFGEAGDAYFRLSLVSPQAQLEQAVTQIKASPLAALLRQHPLQPSAAGLAY